MIAHPCLLLNDHRVEVAKANIAQHEWAQTAYQELKVGADRLREMKLPKFETAWWQEASKKHYSQTHAVVYQHTCIVPRPPIDLAWKSALVYSLGGGREYADRAKEVLLHYTKLRFLAETHPDSGLFYSSWGISALQAYDMLYDDFTPEERLRLDDFFKRMVWAIADNDALWIEKNFGGRYNNHVAWHKAMMLAYGLFYGEPKWIERAMESDQGIRDLMENGFRDDGTWFESSLNYHFVALTALIQSADMMRVSKYPLDLYTHEFAGGRTLEQGFSGMLQVAFPDTLVPPIGDTYGGLIRLNNVQQYEYAWQAYRKPVYAWLLSQVRRGPDFMTLFREAEPSGGKPPSVKSRDFPEHGHVMLRSIEGREYWGSDSWAAFLSYDLDSIHSHRDKLDFILFGRGKLLAPDCEARPSAAHAFSAQIQNELNRTTVCHNTLMVDGKSHQGVREKLSLLEFKRTPDVKTATAADLKGLVYPGVRMQRTVAVTDDYVLDVFQAASDAEHTWDWLFHAVDDDGKTEIAGDFRPFEFPAEPPWTWLRNARSARMDGRWQADWTQGDVRFRLTMLGEPGTEVIECDFPRNDRFEAPAFPMLMARRTGKSAVYVALYQAEKGELPSADVKLSTGDGKLKVSVALDGRTREHDVRTLR
ncbi:MAG: alginate lyase family protein [Armatimonadetes bacterium]|nr:alginate lyase family protein [Armatimonadota bacterium]